jgi:hypothetical protein
VAWAYVNSTTADGSASVTSFALAPTWNITVGNRLMVVVTVQAASAPSVSSMTDTAGNSYRKMGAAADTTPTATELWSCPIVLGGGTKPTITANFAAASTHYSISILEYSGLSVINDTDALDGFVATANASSTTSAAGPTGASTASNELRLMVYGDWGNSITVTSASGTTRVSFNDTKGGVVVAEVDTGSSGSTSSASFTLSAAHPSVAIVAVFRLSAGSNIAWVSDVSTWLTTAATSLTLTPVTASGPGSLLVLSAATGKTATPSPTITSVTDNKGQTWVKAVANNPAATKTASEIWYVANSVAGVTSVTANLSASSAISMHFQEFVNADTVSPLAQTNSGTGTSTAPTSGSITTTMAHTAIVGSICQGSSSNTAVTATPAWTVVDPLHNSSPTGVTAGESHGIHIPTATGTFTWSGTLATSTTWAATIAAFKEAVPTIRPAPPRVVRQAVQRAVAA